MELLRISSLDSNTISRFNFVKKVSWKFSVKVLGLCFISSNAGFFNFSFNWESSFFLFGKGLNRKCEKWGANQSNELAITPPPTSGLALYIKYYEITLYLEVSLSRQLWCTGFRHRGSTLGHRSSYARYQSLNIIIIIIIISQRRRPICLVTKSKQRNLVVSLKSTMMLNGQSSAKTWNINISMFRKHQQYQLLVNIISLARPSSGHDDDDDWWGLEQVLGGSHQI